MDGILTDRDRSGRFATGNRVHDAKRSRIAVKVRQLAADYDAVTPAQKMMLNIAAKNLDTAEITRNPTTRERSSNVALRLLSEIPKRQKRPRRSRGVTMAEIEALERQHGKA